jgi:hypothetical protein
MGKTVAVLLALLGDAFARILGLELRVQVRLEPAHHAADPASVCEASTDVVVPDTLIVARGQP